jgi:hypothetical protein
VVIGAGIIIDGVGELVAGGLVMPGCGVLEVVGAAAVGEPANGP